jgi:hypothetical protein
MATNWKEKVGPYELDYTIFYDTTNLVLGLVSFISTLRILWNLRRRDLRPTLMKAAIGDTSRVGSVRGFKKVCYASGNILQRLP